MRVKGLVAAAVASAAILLTGAIAPRAVVASTSQTLAQVTVAANCDNPNYALCAPPPNGFGTGGIWFWVEIDAGGTGVLSGADCGHTVGGVGGPGGAGADSIKGPITWTSVATVPPGAPLFAVDPQGNYYLVNLPGGAGRWLVPKTPGHYSFRPTNGVQVQTTVAP